jgi:ribosomal-protein-alanine N-acetyltransferase
VSALLENALVFRAMRVADLDSVCGIENRVYPFPWTRGNFSDSIDAGYVCTILECDAVIVGYAVLAVAAGESHLLNLSIDKAWQRRGLGRALLLHLIDAARAREARIMLLEVRPSNTAARALYSASGFSQITVRRGYYPDTQGREDALLLSIAL